MAGKKGRSRGPITVDLTKVGIPPKDARTQRKASGSNGIIEKLKGFYGFMNENGLDALELSESGFHVRLVRRKTQAPAAVPVPVYLQGAGAPAVSSKPAEPVVQNGTTVKSSMMGIFYRAPTPSAPPFVKEGDAVKAGQVVCMIEAMKVFNELKAEFPCTVLKVLLENGKPVRSGQDLFLVQR